MARDSADDLRIPLGRARSRAGRADTRFRPFVKQVEAAIRKAGGNPNWIGGPAGKRSGRFNARGRGARLSFPRDGGGWQRDSAGRFRARRVVVKARVVKHDPCRNQRGALGPKMPGHASKAADHLRYYFDAFGVHAELFLGATSQWNDFLMVGGAMIGLRVLHADSSVTTRYFHTDNLGSIAVITDENGNVVERDGYDAWGKRRYPTGADDPAGQITSQTTTRGFTGQEELDFGLVHLNGRVYDPLVGRMLSADPYVPDPLNGQAWNRYSYVINNPLAFTDPSGYCFLGMCTWGRAISTFFDRTFGVLFRDVPILGTLYRRGGIVYIGRRPQPRLRGGGLRVDHVRDRRRQRQPRLCLEGGADRRRHRAAELRGRGHHERSGGPGLPVECGWPRGHRLRLGRGVGRQMRSRRSRRRRHRARRARHQRPWLYRRSGDEFHGRRPRQRRRRRQVRKRRSHRRVRVPV